MALLPIELALRSSSDTVDPGNRAGKNTFANNAAKRWLFWAGIALLFIPGLVHAYLLMPFPGSQTLEAINVCYYLEKVIAVLRVIGAVILLVYLFNYFLSESTRGKILKSVLLLVCLGTLYFTDVAYKAEAMFKEPKDVKFANALFNKVPQSYIIIGVINNGVAKAYPVKYLGYHHKVQDNIGGKPVMVTYCTMCRTGRVFNPVINGKAETFRLVGARHYNAIIEDESTKSWWYQATGVAAVGPAKGQQLQEIAYEQSTLSGWLAKHPESLIMQPDKRFTAEYADLKNYDRVQPIDKDKTQKNKNALVRKSWVLGVVVNKQAKAYDWRQLFKQRVLNDQIINSSLLIGIEKDSLTFHAWNRMIDGKALHFATNTDGLLTDKETASVWNWDGLCISGINKGKKLDKIQAYQEYWHSWKFFHPATTLVREAI